MLYKVPINHYKNTHTKFTNEWRIWTDPSDEIIPKKTPKPQTDKNNNRNTTNKNKKNHTHKKMLTLTNN